MNSEKKAGRFAAEHRTRLLMSPRLLLPPPILPLRAEGYLEGTSIGGKEYCRISSISIAGKLFFQLLNSI